MVESERTYARGGGGSGTTDASKGPACTADGTYAHTVVAGSAVGCARIAVPKRETKAAGASFVLRHEQGAGDFGFVWCMGHSCPLPCAHVQACSSAGAIIPAQTEAAFSVSENAWHRR